VYLFTSPGSLGEKEIIEILLGDTPLFLLLLSFFPNEHIVYASSYHFFFMVGEIACEHGGLGKMWMCMAF